MNKVNQRISQFFRLPQQQASKDLQAKLDAATGAGSSKEPFTHNEAPVPKKPAASAAKSKAQPPTGTPVPVSEAAKQARLRRVCERKPSGRIKVPEEIHQKWRTGSRADRDELMDVLEACDFDQDLQLHEYMSIANVKYTIKTPTSWVFRIWYFQVVLHDTLYVCLV